MCQSIIDPKLKDAATKAWSLKIPFALTILPDNTSCRFFASTPDEETGSLINVSRGSDDFFFAAPFGQSIYGGVAVYDEMSADDVLNMRSSLEQYPFEDNHTSDSSTPYAFYYGQIRSILKDIRRGAVDKVVLSRRIACDIPRRSPADIAEEYFSRVPDTFRALFYTPETGLWLTATPELLLAADNDSEVSHISTCAIAGSRPAASTDVPWDEKNIKEHTVVLDFILSTLRRHKVEPVVTGPSSRRFGALEHLVHEIECRECPTSKVISLIDDLNPTPALAGYPVAKALKIIRDTELHRRQLYGGVTGILTDNSIRAYVNIRCALISEYLRESPILQVNIFSGGGIVDGSQPDREWIEAGLKAMPLVSVLCPQYSDEILSIPTEWQGLRL